MMVAKMVVREVIQQGEPPAVETVKLAAVTAKPFDANGENEDNSFARYTPSANLEMMIANPALLGRIKVGDTFKLTFDKCE